MSAQRTPLPTPPHSFTRKRDPARPRTRAVVRVLGVVRASWVLVGLAAALASSVLLSSCGSAGESSSTEVLVSGAPSSGTAPTGGSVIRVHVVGAVGAPGIVELDSGARVDDAVRAAGGPAEDAALDSVNLARPVADGEQIVVLTRDAQRAAAADHVGDSTVVGSAPGTDRLVNINRADEDELDSLPRIGPATASKIVDSRSSEGPFASVDDLGRIPGIGEKTIEALRPLVTV